MKQAAVRLIASFVIVASLESACRRHGFRRAVENPCDRRIRCCGAGAARAFRRLVLLLPAARYARPVVATAGAAVTPFVTG